MTLFTRYDVLKEACLHGAAYELVQNLDNIDEIWKRLSERYGDYLDIVFGYKRFTRCSHT